MKATRTQPRTYRRDLTGERFGRLTVVREADPVHRPNGSPIRRWLCRCDCGTETIARQTDLRNGKSMSCGCSRKENPGANRRPSAGYASAHRRVQTDRGKATNWPCVDCGSSAHEWSYDGEDPDELVGLVHGAVVSYSLKSEHYTPRCRSCHRRFDATRERA